MAVLVVIEHVQCAKRRLTDDAESAPPRPAKKSAHPERCRFACARSHAGAHDSRKGMRAIRKQQMTKFVRDHMAEHLRGV